MVVDAMRRMIASGKAAGTLESDNALARPTLDPGCTFVRVGREARRPAVGVRALGAGLGDADAPPPAIYCAAGGAG